MILPDFPPVALAMAVHVVPLCTKLVLITAIMICSKWNAKLLRNDTIYRGITRSMSMHPPVGKKLLDKKSDDLESLFCPEFKTNYEYVKSIEPWVPERLRDKVRSEREEKMKSEKWKSLLEEASRKVEQFYPSDSSNDTDPSAEGPFADYVQEYKHLMQKTREKYAQEMKEELKRISEQESIHLSELSKTDGSKRDTQISSDSDFSMEKVHRSVDMICDTMMKRIKFESHQETLRKQSQERAKNLLRLYHESPTFITPENLESRIEQTLAKTSKLPYIKRRKLEASCQKYLKKTQREIALYDALNDTVDGKQKVFFY